MVGILFSSLYLSFSLCSVPKAGLLGHTCIRCDLLVHSSLKTIFRQNVKSLTNFMDIERHCTSIILYYIYIIIAYKNYNEKRLNLLKIKVGIRWRVCHLANIRFIITHIRVCIQQHIIAHSMTVKRTLNKSKLGKYCVHY